ncbi:MAG: hypothetical protein ACPGTO_02490 [Polaribacter sp.]
MQKRFAIFLFLCPFLVINAQKKPAVKKVKDTVKTEVVNVVTTYNPKIADANKIKKNPTIELLKNSEKKKLKYTIFSAPVASTFIPKSGVVKGIDVGVKERIYKNYMAGGFGNYMSPYFETFLHHNTRFENEFGFSAKYSASEDNVRNSVLNSNFSNFSASTFFKKEERYFDWKVGLYSERNEYNWYGLPTHINFDTATVNAINEEQKYNYFKLVGELTFEDSYIEYSKLLVSYFTDTYESKEAFLDFNTKLDFPLDFLNLNLNEISLNTNFEVLRGEFKNSYQDESPINYSLITAKISPTYTLTYNDFSLKLGTKLALSLDSENNSTNLLIYPEILINKSIVKNYLSVYGGVTGDLKTNRYKSFTEENPYVSPTLFITQTSEKFNSFLGIHGRLSNDISFNIKGSIKEEEDKPLYLKNNSKSNGTTSTLSSTILKGYEYGNSFGVYYDDIKTTTFFAEIEYDFTKRIVLGTTIQHNSYTTTNSLEAFNLPTLQASFFGTYKSNKWYATTNVFYVSERKDASYNSIYPSTFSGTETINSFMDLNLNGGYHFNDKFSVFLKANNILNTNYQRFANFDTQGFQILGGITYKFDF